MQTMEDSEFGRVALRAAREAAVVIADRHRLHRHAATRLRVDTKADRTPVTEADRAAEQVIESVLRTAFPEHGFFGEEGGRRAGAGEFTWLVDPIDGTKSFLRGLVDFVSTQIALCRGGEFILGVSCAPLRDELACAEIGSGAWLDGTPLRVSDVGHIEDAAISFANVRSLARSPCWPRVGELLQTAYHVRGFGDFYHYHRLAAGEIDAVFESDVSILDVAALSVIVTAAGGRVTDLDGRPLSLTSTSILATNGRLHQPLLDFLRG